MKKRTTLILIFILCLGTIFSGCVRQHKNNFKYTLNVPKLILNIHEEYCLEMLENDIVLAQDVEWKSENHNVVEVENGVVTAIGVGTSLVTASYRGNIVGLNVEVKEKRMGLSHKKVTVVQGDTFQLNFMNEEEDDLSDVLWSTGDPNIVNVEKGLLLGIKSGRTVAIARYKDIDYICDVTVLDSFELSGRYVSEIYIEQMSKTFEFEIVVNSKKEYIYKRLANNDFIEEEINRGTVRREKEIVVFEGGKVTMKFTIADGNTLVSVSSIPTNKIDIPMVFKRK